MLIPSYPLVHVAIENAVRKLIRNNCEAKHDIDG
jgi:hypothetical protein